MKDKRKKKDRTWAEAARLVGAAQHCVCAPCVRAARVPPPLCWRPLGRGRESERAAVRVRRRKCARECVCVRVRVECGREEGSARRCEEVCEGVCEAVREGV